MKFIITGYNLVLKVKDFSPASLRLGKLRDAINEAMDSFKSPIINQFPGITVFIYAEQQLSLSFQKNTVIISDTSTMDVAEGVDAFIDIVKTVEKELKSEGTMVAYGFNYEVDIELENNDTSVLCSLIDEDALDSKGLVPPGELITSPVKIVRKLTEEHFVALDLIPLLKNYFEDSNKIRCKYNLHWEGVHQLKDVTTLKEDYKSSYVEFLKLLEKLDE